MKENECTIVTAFYNFPKKKSSNLQYDRWIKNFLENTNAYMVIFTDSHETAGYLWGYRQKFIEKTKVLIEKLEDLSCYQYYDYWSRDLARDHEKAYHNENLYIIWNEKTMFMYKAYILNYFDTEFYAWTDIGMVREDRYIKLLESFPSSKRLAKLQKNKVYILLINHFTNEEMTTVTPTETFRFKDRIGGGMILCNRHILEKWTQEYYKMMKNFMEADMFAGKDQSIMANLVLKYKTEFIEIVVAKPADYRVMDNIWFHMLYFLSDYYIE